MPVADPFLTVGAVARSSALPSAQSPDPVDPDQVRPGGWLGLMYAMWDLAEVLYAPCFAPVQGTCLMFDGNGALSGCSTDQTGDGSTPSSRTDV